MPIRPEDFDAAAPRRQAGGGSASALTGARDKQQRTSQKRETFSSVGHGRQKSRALPWAIAALIAALILFASEKPLANLVRNLLSNPAPARVTTHPTPRAQFIQMKPPAGQPIEPADHVPETHLETFSKPHQDPENADHPVSGPNRKPAHQTTSSEGNPALAIKEDLRRQQEEVELEKKSLADQQAALEKQRQVAAEEAARASEQARQEELQRQQKLQELENSLRAKQVAVTPATALPYSGPTSGTLTWEGFVDGADLIDIQNGSPNHGNLSGALPGVPVMVQAFPPDAVTISVPPGPSNQWKRIVLRVRAKGLKKVTVRWALP